MTYVFNEERGFKDEFLDGLTAAYARYLRRVPGASAVMSVTAPAMGRVSVIIGGGSGHYPAFAGLVGPGLCDGAIVGEVFSSPSAEQAYRCVRALDGGAGILLSFGNYSGDVMHFGLAAQRARADGMDVRTVLVTDDVASAPRDRISDRRGIAGGFFVFRAASSAAHDGRSIHEVEQLALRVNAATFTFGVAFQGCTFPGRAEPLFTVERGRIELGLGIHGEPGLRTIDWLPAEELADVVLAPLLEERPVGATRVQVLLNGLGSTKYEEMFVLYRAISRRLSRAGIEPVSPEVGEYVTSLDMAGCSLTLCWLDDEIERLLAAPAAAPGFRAGTLSWPTAGAGSTRGPDRATAQPVSGSVRTGRSVGHRGRHRATPAAQDVVAAFEAMTKAVSSISDHLGQLDSVAGDGDHGAGMVRGFSAATRAAALAGPTVADVLAAAGVAFSDAAGGASGALWGAGLIAAAEYVRTRNERLSRQHTAEPDVLLAFRALTAAQEAVIELGQARPGDKTLLDALTPFVDALGTTSETTLPQAWRSAAIIAERAAAATADLASRKGRASVHGERSRGTPDPGAISLAVALRAAGESFAATFDHRDGQTADS